MPRGHNRAPFNSCVCVCQSVCACVRLNRGGWLSKKVKARCCFPSVWCHRRAWYSLRSSLDNKAWMIQCWGSALFQLLLHQPISHELSRSLSHSNTRQWRKKTYKRKVRCMWWTKHNLISSMSHWKGIRTTFHQLPLAKRIPHCTFQSRL